MGKFFLDPHSGNSVFSPSDTVAISPEGKMIVRMNDNAVLDVDSGRLHVILSRKTDDGDD